VLIGKLKSRFSNQLLQGVSWLALGEILHRVMRLGTIVILARLLSAYDYGLIAIVFLTIEFANTFTLQGGITKKLIYADDTELNHLANTSYWMNWIIHIGIFVLQCIASLGIGWFYHDSNVILPICCVAATYLILPIFAVQGALIQRESRIKVVALAGLTNSVLTNVMTIGFALMGLGIWSVVLAHVLSHISWLVIYLTNHTWRPSGKFQLDGGGDILRFAKDPIGVELLEKFRSNLDYLLIGRFIGVEALGIYYFAFNAGLGISLSIVSMFSTTLLPYFCEVRADRQRLKQRYLHGLKMIACVAFPLVIIQSLLAPFYVPIIFGQKWVAAVPILIIVCLSGIPRPFASASEQLLLSLDRGPTSLKWNLIFTAILTVALCIAVQWNTYSVAIAVLVTHVIALPLFTLWVARSSFSSIPKPS
jgi:O-antigen/teichoic acid export membrane protein